MKRRSTRYVVTFEQNPAIPAEVVSEHKTLRGARRAFRARNPHLFDKEFAERCGMQHHGTFDCIRSVEDGELGQQEGVRE